MPESPEALYARVVAQVGTAGRLPSEDPTRWEMFPWEVLDGRLVTKVLGEPEQEKPRRGEAEDKPCGTCAGDEQRPIWENDRWSITPPPQPTGMPLVLFLQSKEHLDFTDMDDDLAAEYGRLSARLCRIMSNLPHIGRVHVCRWGDGGAHLHVWFIARPWGFAGVIGSMAVEWEGILPPPPEEIWRADLKAVAEKLAYSDGRALV
ncbi:MAG: hypothetical protein M3Z50_10100 [Actinomycetota bacterium]|nr:hypothetical protein [Actinomycetota bacterium]